jgi:hypothetical protein
VLAHASDDELLERLLGRKCRDLNLAAVLELDGAALAAVGFSEAEASLVIVVAEIARRHQPTERRCGSRDDDVVDEAHTNQREASPSGSVITRSALLATRRLMDRSPFRNQGCRQTPPVQFAQELALARSETT